jgi:hypothetical protein
MKILVTGMNKNQVTENFYLRQQLRVVPSHYSLLRCLRDMGHDVEQRYVKVGEDLSMYDKVICFLASPRQALQLLFYNGLWAIQATPKDKLVLAFDDWQTDGIFKGILSCIDKESLLKEFTINQNATDPQISKEFLEPYTDSLLEAVNYVGKKEAPILLSVFAGGDMSKIIDYDKDKVFGYNPNPYHRNRTPGDRGDIEKSEMNFMESQLQPSFEEDFVSPENKEKKFNFASLVQSSTAKWLKKQNINNWDIEYFGSRKEKQRRLSEEDMCKVYGEQWGCLMPGYVHSGSGWWRARPLQVTDAGSILIGDYEELMVLYGNEEAASVKASDLETMSVQQLKDLAELQKSSIYTKHPLDKNTQQIELKKALNI